MGVNIKFSKTFYHVGNTPDKNRRKFTFTPKDLNPVHTRKFLNTFVWDRLTPKLTYTAIGSNLYILFMQNKDFLAGPRLNPVYTYVISVTKIYMRVGALNPWL
jgi:hypothetical protein